MRVLVIGNRGQLGSDVVEVLERNHSLAILGIDYPDIDITDPVSVELVFGGFDPDFVRGALDARTGIPTKPVKSSFGWHIIYVRPFTAVSDSLSTTLNAAAGEYLLLGALAEADISVASRYGKWDPLAGRVVAP